MESTGIVTDEILEAVQRAPHESVMPSEVLSTLLICLLCSPCACGSEHTQLTQSAVPQRLPFVVPSPTHITGYDGAASFTDSAST